jgi:hypothetical protein
VGQSLDTLPPRGPDTVTGSKAVDAAMGSDISPRSKARRHLNTWFAFTPCALAIATCEHDVPSPIPLPAP